MNVSLRVPRMTRDQFLDWAAQQDAPYEFDGFEPVAMTGGTIRHALLCANLLVAIRSRLDRAAFSVVVEVGLATVGDAVRYPDVAILRAGGSQSERLMSDVVVAFEVMSPTSVRLDRTIKLREYRAVSSIQRYVIVGNTGPDLTDFTRQPGGGAWLAAEVMEGEVLAMPEVGIELPVDEIFAGIIFD